MKFPKFSGLRTQSLEAGGLVRALLIGMGLAIALCLVGIPAGLRFSPLPVMIISCALSALVWLLRSGVEPAPPPEWAYLGATEAAPRFRVDLRTRRVRDILAGAQPGRDFTHHQLAGLLLEITVDRLRRRPDIDPKRPLGTSKNLLSKGLHTYLSAAADPNADPPTVSRRTLHAYLKEIDRI